LLIIPELFFKAIIIIVDFIASIEWAKITLLSLNLIGMVFFYFMLFVMSKFFLVNFKKKVTVLTSLLCICLTLMFLFDSPYVPNKFTYTQLNSTDDCAIITTESGEVFMIGGTDDLEFVQSYLKFSQIRKIDTIVVVSVYDETLADFIKTYQVSNVIYDSENTVTLGEFTIEFIYFNNIKKAVYIERSGFSVLFACNIIGSVQAQTLQEKFSSYDIDLLFEPKNSYGFDAVYNFENVLSRYKISKDNQSNYATISLGSFTFGFENDTIQNMRRVL